MEVIKVINLLKGLAFTFAGLFGLSFIIYLNGVLGIGVGTFWTASFMSLGIGFFGCNLFIGILLIKFTFQDNGN